MEEAMVKRYSLIGGLLAISFGVGLFVGRAVPLSAQGKTRAFEIRTATTSSRSSRDALVDRFRKEEVRLFEKNGMKGIGFFVPSDAPRSENTFFYILGHESRERAKESWDKFRVDPEWQTFRQTFEDIGAITVDSMFVDPLDFSPLK